MNQANDPHADELRRKLRQGDGKLSPAAARLARAVFDTPPDELPHDECIAELPAYVTAEVDGEDPGERWPKVRRHLENCASCSELYTGLLKVSLAEEAGEIPVPAEIPAADLSFLPLNFPALVGELARAILAALAPAELPAFDRIAGRLLERLDELGPQFVREPVPLVGTPLAGGELDPTVLILADTYVATHQVLDGLTPEELDRLVAQGQLRAQLEEQARLAALAIKLDPQGARTFAAEFARLLCDDPARLRDLIRQPRAERRRRAGILRAAEGSEHRVSPVKRVSVNILAIPSRTTMLFVLIVLVVLLPVFAAFGAGSPVCAPFVLFWLLALSLYRFLREPIAHLRAHAMTDPGSCFPELARRWTTLAAQQGIRAPRLMLTSTRHVTAGFGTVRRWYCALSNTRAAELERQLGSDDPAEQRWGESVLMHELAHFGHHDVEMAFWTKSLLTVAIPFLALDFIFYVLAPWLYTSIIVFIDVKRFFTPDVIRAFSVFSPEIAAALADPPQVTGYVWVNWLVFVFAAHWPLLVGCGILLVFFWPALMRTRELYADARVARLQHSGEPLSDELGFASLDGFRPAPRRDRWDFVRAPLGRLRLLVADRVGNRCLAAVDRVGRWRAVHPLIPTRRRCLKQPHEIYGTDRDIGLTAGIAAVLLNLNLDSLFLSRYVRGPNSTVPFLIGYTVLALSLLPFLCRFPRDRVAYAAKTRRVVLLFTGIKLIPQLTAAAFVTLGILTYPGLIDRAASALNPGAGPETATGIGVDFVLQTFVIRPAVLFAVGMPPILLLWLRIDAVCKRHILRWYGAPLMARWPGWLLGGTTFWLALVLALIVLPILDAVTVPTAHDLGDPGTLIGFLVGLVALIAGLALGRGMERRYAGRCPGCGEQIEGEFEPGLTCPACRVTLHPNLYAIEPDPADARQVKP